MKLFASLLALAAASAASLAAAESFVQSTGCNPFAAMPAGRGAAATRITLGGPARKLQTNVVDVSPARVSLQLQPNRAGVSSVTFSLPGAGATVPDTSASSSVMVTLWQLYPEVGRSAATNSSQSAVDNEDTLLVDPLLDFTYTGVLVPEVVGSGSAAGTAGADIAAVTGAWNDTSAGRASLAISSARLARRGFYEAVYRVYTATVPLSTLAAQVGSSPAGGYAALTTGGSPAVPSGAFSAGQAVPWRALVTSAAVCPTSVQYSMPPNQQDSTVTVEITNLDVTGVVLVVTPSIDVGQPTSPLPADGILRTAERIPPPAGPWFNASFNTNGGAQYGFTVCEEWVCAFSATASSPLDGVPYAVNVTARSAGPGAHPENIPPILTAASVPAGSTLGVYLNVFYTYPGATPRLQQAQEEHFTLHFFEEVLAGDADYIPAEAGVPQYRLLEQRVVSVSMTRLLGRASRARSELMPLRQPSNAFVQIRAQGQGMRPVAVLAMRDAFGHPRPCAGDVPVVEADQFLVELPGAAATAGDASDNSSAIVTSFTPIGPGLYLISMRAALPGLVHLSARLSSASTAPLQPLQIKVLPADCSEGGVLPDAAQNNMTCLCAPGHGGAVSDGISAAQAQRALQDQAAATAPLADIWGDRVAAALAALVDSGMPQSISEVSLATGGFADTGGIDVCNIYTQGNVALAGALNIPPHIPAEEAFHYSALESLASLTAAAESAGRVECSPCDPGERSSGFSVEQCLSCSAGQFSAPGAENCRACPDFGATCVNGVLRVEDDHWWEGAGVQSAADAATGGFRFHACPFLGLCNVEDVAPTDLGVVAAGDEATASGGARRLAHLATHVDFASGSFATEGAREMKRWWAAATAGERPAVASARALQTLGNFTLVNTSAAALALGAQTEQHVYCRDGHRGPLCQSCDPGYVNGGTGACLLCTNVAVSWLLFALTVIGISAFAVFWIRRRVRRSRFRTTQSGAQRIGISFIQMCTVLTALRLRVPELFGVIEQGGAVGDGVSMDLYPIQCTFKPSYHERLLGYMLLPLLAMFLPAIILFATLPLRQSMWRKREDKRQALLAKMEASGAVGAGATAAAKDDALMANPMRVAGSKALASDAPASKNTPASGSGEGAAGDDKVPAAAGAKDAKKPKIPRAEEPPTVDGSKNLAYASAVVLVFLVYNRVFRELVSAFHEYQFPVEGHRRLAADLTVEADSPTHLGWRVIAGILLALYAVGLPIGTLVLLYRNREHLWPTAEGLALEEQLKRGVASTDVAEGAGDGKKKARRQSQAFRQVVKIQGKMAASDKSKLSALLAKHQVFHRYSFLYDGYRHDLYWWETLVLLRKILVVLVSATITDGHTQMFAAAGIVTIALALQLSVQPYLIPALNALETMSLVSTLMLMLGSLLFWQVGAERGPALALTAILFMVLIATLMVFIYAMLGGASKVRLRKAVGEKNFKMCTRCIKRSCKNKRSPAEIRAEMLADEAQYDASVASTGPLAAKTGAESKQGVTSSGIGTAEGGMMGNPLAGRNPLMSAAASAAADKSRKGFAPQGTK